MPDNSGTSESDGTLVAELALVPVDGADGYQLIFRLNKNALENVMPTADDRARMVAEFMHVLADGDFEVGAAIAASASAVLASYEACQRTPDQLN